MKIINHLIHGSEDSIDVDVYYIVDELCTFAESKKMCDALNVPPINANLITVKDGKVTGVYKGTVDEVNNSILATYHLHEQIHPNPITQRAERDICLKWLRVIRGILSHCSRTEYRGLIKEALRSENVFDKLKAISEIDFTQISDFGKEPAKEVHKFICFQIAQYVGLLVGTEIYSKSQAAEFFNNPAITKFLYRQDSEVKTLGYLVKMFLNTLPIKTGGHEYKISNDGTEIVTPFGVLNTKSEKYL